MNTNNLMGSFTNISYDFASNLIANLGAVSAQPVLKQEPVDHMEAFRKSLFIEEPVHDLTPIQPTQPMHTELSTEPLEQNETKSTQVEQFLFGI